MFLFPKEKEDQPASLTAAVCQGLVMSSKDLSVAKARFAESQRYPITDGCYHKQFGCKVLPRALVVSPTLVAALQISLQTKAP